MTSTPQYVTESGADALAVELLAPRTQQTGP